MSRNTKIQDPEKLKPFVTVCDEGFDLPGTSTPDHRNQEQQLSSAQQKIQTGFTTLLGNSLQSQNLPGNVGQFGKTAAVTVLQYNGNNDVYTATVTPIVNFLIDGVTYPVRLGSGFECQFSKQKSQGFFAALRKDKYCLSEIKLANEDAPLFDVLAGLSTGNSTYDQYKCNAYLFDQILKTLSDEALIRHRASLIQFAKSFDFFRQTPYNDRRAEKLFERIAKYLSAKSLDEISVVVADNLQQPTAFQSLLFKIEKAGKPFHNNTTNQTEMCYYVQPEQTNTIRTGVVVNPQRYISFSLQEKIKNTLEKKIHGFLSASTSVSIAIEKTESSESEEEFLYSYKITATIAGVQISLGDLSCAVSKFNSSMQPLTIGHSAVVTQIRTKHCSFPIVLALSSDNTARKYQQPDGVSYSTDSVNKSIKMYFYEQAVKKDSQKSWQQIFNITTPAITYYAEQKKRASIDVLVDAFKKLNFTATQNADHVTAIFKQIATDYLPKNVEDYLRVLSETAIAICDAFNGNLKDKTTNRTEVWRLALQDVMRVLRDISLNSSQKNELVKVQTIIFNEHQHVSDRANDPHTSEDLMTQFHSPAAQSSQPSPQRTEAEEPLPATVSSGMLASDAQRTTHAVILTSDIFKPKKNEDDYIRKNFTRKYPWHEWKFCNSEIVSADLKIDDTIYHLLENPKKAKEDFKNNRTPATLKRILEEAYKSYKKLHAVQLQDPNIVVHKPAPAPSTVRTESDETQLLVDTWEKQSSEEELLTDFLHEDKALSADSWKTLVEQKGRNRPTFFRGLRIYALEDITIENVDFSGYDLSNCKFFGEKNKKIIFKNCKFKGANLSDAQFDCAVALAGTTTISGAKTAGAVAREWSTESPVNTLFYESKESRRGLRVTERFSYSVQVDARSRPRRVWDWLLTPIRALTKSRLSLTTSIQVFEQKQLDGSVTLLLFKKRGDDKSAPGRIRITEAGSDGLSYTAVIANLLGTDVNKRLAVFQNKNFTGLPPHQQMLMILQYAEEHPSSKIAVAVDWFISTSTATTTTTSAPSSSSVTLPVVSSVSVPPIPTMTGAAFRTRIEEIIKNKKASRAITNYVVNGDVDLNGLDLSGFKFTNIRFNDNATFQRAKLTDALFTNVTFGADVDFSGANLAGMKLRDTTVADTMITDDQTVRVDRTHVDAGIMTSTTMHTETGAVITKYDQITKMRYDLKLSGQASQIVVSYYARNITITPNGNTTQSTTLTTFTDFDNFYAAIKKHYLANKPRIEFNKITQAEKLFPHNTSGTDDESIHTAIRRIEYLLSCAQSESKQKNSAIRNAFDSAITFLIPTRAAAAAATATTGTTTVIMSPTTPTTASPSQPAVQPPEGPPAVAAAEPSTTTDTSKKPFNDLDDDVPLHAATSSNLPAAAASASPVRTEALSQKPNPQEELVTQIFGAPNDTKLSCWRTSDDIKKWIDKDFHTGLCNAEFYRDINTHFFDTGTTDENGDVQYSARDPRIAPIVTIFNGLLQYELQFRDKLAYEQSFRKHPYTSEEFHEKILPVIKNLDRELYLGLQAQIIDVQKKLKKNATPPLTLKTEQTQQSTTPAVAISTATPTAVTPEGTTASTTDRRSPTPPETTAAARAKTPEAEISQETTTRSPVAAARAARAKTPEAEISQQTDVAASASAASAESGDDFASLFTNFQRDAQKELEKEAAEAAQQARAAEQARLFAEANARQQKQQAEKLAKAQKPIQTDEETTRKKLAETEAHASRSLALEKLKIHAAIAKARADELAKAVAVATTAKTKQLGNATLFVNANVRAALLCVFSYSLRLATRENQSATTRPPKNILDYVDTLQDNIKNDSDDNILLYLKHDDLIWPLADKEDAVKVLCVIRLQQEMKKFLEELRSDPTVLDDVVYNNKRSNLIGCLLIQLGVAQKESHVAKKPALSPLTGKQHGDFYGRIGDDQQGAISALKALQVTLSAPSTPSTRDSTQSSASANSVTSSRSAASPAGKGENVLADITQIYGMVASNQVFDDRNDVFFTHLTKKLISQTQSSVVFAGQNRESSLQVYKNVLSSPGNVLQMKQEFRAIIAAIEESPDRLKQCILEFIIAREEQMMRKAKNVGAAAHPSDAGIFAGRNTRTVVGGSTPPLTPKNPK